MGMSIYYKSYYRNAEETLNIIDDLEKQIKRYENKISILEDDIYRTMKKPISEIKFSAVALKWDNKVKTIRQEYKGIRRLKRNILRFKKDIDILKSYSLKDE